MQYTRSTDGVAAALVVSHVSRCGAELCISLDDFVYRIKKVLLCGNLQEQAYMLMVTAHHKNIKLTVQLW